MNIPEGAFAVAVGAIMNQGKWYDPADAQFAAQVALEAAAPHIAAQVLRDFADEEFRRDGATLVVERLLVAAEGIEPYDSLTNS